MTLNEYQEAARTTAIYTNVVIYPALGLASEAGEVAGLVKKMLRDEKGILSEERRQKLIDELGDCLYYIAALASDINVTIDEVAARNTQKLADRMARGVIRGSGDNR